MFDPPKWMVKWWKQWKTLFFNGWFGGFSHYFWVDTHIILVHFQNFKTVLTFVKSWGPFLKLKILKKKNESSAEKMQEWKNQNEIKSSFVKVSHWQQYFDFKMFFLFNMFFLHGAQYVWNRYKNSIHWLEDRKKLWFPLTLILRNLGPRDVFQWSRASCSKHPGVSVESKLRDGPK